MSARWIGMLVAWCEAAVAALSSWRRRNEKTDLGTVSERWLSEQRNDRHLSER